MLKKLIINYLGREKRYALVDGKKIEKLIIEQPKHQSDVGSIYLGTITKVLPGMNAAFVDLGEDRNGYLHRDKLPAFVLSPLEQKVKDQKGISSFVHQGEKLLVQVEKDATFGKGPRLSGLIELTGEALIYMPHGKYVAVSKKIADQTVREEFRQLGYQLKDEAEGLIFRTNVKEKTMAELREELDQLREQYEDISRKGERLKKPSLIKRTDLFMDEILFEIEKNSSIEVLVDDLELKHVLESFYKENKISFYQGKENIFTAHQIQSEVEKALKRIVWLENGAYIIIEETEALTIIDVNTGKFSGKSDRSQTVRQTNQWAAAEIGRQIRLRDLAGIILIDFIDMKDDSDRKEVMHALEKELKKDHRQSRIIGFTSLGILQLTRKKTKVSLQESLTTRCQTCEGTGRVLSAETVAFQLERELWEYKTSDYEAVQVELSESVQSIFSGEDHVHLKRLEEALSFKILFVTRQSPKPFFHIRKLGSVKELIEKEK
ncbi:Rne/Rng family ribonuclease [Cytobacillus spongiae]|uniref:Rne/Rng family ribonuclease n=1 Tax=Cytobacillus spongiae TaxID=2901381 RepID=UPI0032C43BE6